MKWTEEQTIKFVKEYIKHECLYNVNCNEFGQKHFREVAFKQLSSSMGFPDFGPRDAYLKVRSLKSTYAQELKKIKSSANNVLSDGTPNVYSPKVKWFNILHEALLAGNGVEYCSDVSTNFETVYPEIGKVECLENEEDIQMTNEENTNSISQTNERKPNYFRKQPKRIIVKRDQRSLKDYDNLLAKVQSVANSVTKPVEQYEHEFDIFGKSIAAQLKNMPLDMAIEAQMFMQNYLSEVRLRNLQGNLYNQRSCSSHSNYDISQPSPEQNMESS